MIHLNNLSILRVSLAVVYLWFGVLKVIGASPVVQLIETTYPFMSGPPFIILLGLWETAIGIGLLFKFFLPFTIALLWLQMAGIFFGLIISPSTYFIQNNPLLLNSNGEFVIKNLVLIAATFVILSKVDKKK